MASDTGDRKIRNINIEHKESFSPLEHFAVWITNHIGTMGFFFLVIIWTTSWFIWNTVGPVRYRFDPYPAFVLWLFISNVAQLFFLPLLMIGQNLQIRHAELRAEADLETNLKAEKEIKNILKHSEEQTNLIVKILERLENK